MKNSEIRPHQAALKAACGAPIPPSRHVTRAGANHAVTPDGKARFSCVPMKPKLVSEGMPLGLENMAVIGQELAIRWSDGAESYLPLEFLRRHCPCAFCAGEKDILGKVHRAELNLTPKSFQLKSCASVGSYAIQPEWMDGHGSGIFSFGYLRSLDPNLS
jgi:DUF971 family protein